MYIKKEVWVSTNYLVVQLNVDSIFKTIKDLNDDMDYSHQQKFRLEFSKRRGICFLFI